MITTDNFTTWLGVSPVGERITYHETDHSLAADRTDMPDRPAIPGLDELATAVMTAADAGQVALFQRRRAEGGFEYIAVRVNQPIVVHRPLSARQVDRVRHQALMATE